MTLEDPFFVVKEEVYKALNKTRGLYLRWSDLHRDQQQNQNLNYVCSDEWEWTNTELKNSLRSIEWDLEDLDDTIDIVERNRSKFKVDNRELSSRKMFIDTARQEIKIMKEHILAGTKTKSEVEESPFKYTSGNHYSNVVQSFNSHNNNNNNNLNTSCSGKYTKLENDPESSPARQFFERTALSKKQSSQHCNAVRTLSKHVVGIDLDSEHVGMLDEFSADIADGDQGGKLTSVSRCQKFTSLLHLSTDRRQWIAIAILGVLLIVILLIYFVTL